MSSGQVAPTGAVTPAGGPVPPPTAHGRLTIAPRVLARIASRAASEVDGIESRPPRGPRRRRDAGAGKPPEADVHLHGQRARVSMAVAVRYPRPLWDTVAQVEDLIRRRLAELAGIVEVTFAIEVTDLPSASGSSGRRVI